jgi:hypothetical protein
VEWRRPATGVGSCEFGRLAIGYLHDFMTAGCKSLTKFGPKPKPMLLIFEQNIWRRVNPSDQKKMSNNLVLPPIGNNYRKLSTNFVLI